MENMAQKTSPAPATEPTQPQQPREKQLEVRKEKNKTRPSHSSVYEIVPRNHPASQEEKPVLPRMTFKVRPSTAEAFQNLFSKAHSRGPVGWNAFTIAMSELGFSMAPKYGSAYTFSPPESLQIQRSFTVHRPHKSQIEGYMSLYYARRLNRLYGWDADSFEVD